jgi:hypothetical protein
MPRNQDGRQGHWGLVGLWRSTISATLLFTLLTIAMTWPLALQMDKAVIGWIGDNYAFIWMIGWFRKALCELRSPLFVPMLNYPQGYPLAYADIPFTMVFIGLPASLSTPTLGYNVSMLVSFVLSGLGMYLWVRRLTDNVAAGIIAGIVFAFAPYRMSHLLGHLNLMGTQWFPFYFMSLGDLVSIQKCSWKTIVMASVSLGLVGLTSQYYLYMTLLLSVAYVLSHLLFARRLVCQSGVWRRLGVFAILALPLVILSVTPYLRVAREGNLTHTLEAVRSWSASPTDFILPSPKHLLWGEWIGQTFGRKLRIENTLYIGIISALFAPLALLKRKEAAPQGNNTAKALGLTAGAAFVLALGTDLHWLGQPVEISVPQFVRHWYPYSQTWLPLPGYFLFRFLPFYAGMRVWARYGIFVSLFASVLTGIGVAWLLGQAKRRLAAPLSMLILLVALVDLYPGAQPLSTVAIRPVDAWLISQSSGAVAQFPFSQIKQPQLAYATLIHNKPLIGDPFGTFSTSQSRRIEPILSSFPDQNSVHLLAELGVRWIIVDSARYQDFAQVQAAAQSLGLHFRVVLDGQYVYELDNSPVFGTG